METLMNIFAVVGMLSIGATIGIIFLSIFINNGCRKSDQCPPCNGDCEQGRNCPARKE